MLQSRREAGDRHICPTQEAISGAHDRPHGGDLRLRIQEEVNAGGQCHAKQRQQHHIPRQQQRVGQAQIPPRSGQIGKAQAHRHQVDDQRRKHAGGKIRNRHRRTADGRQQEVSPRAVDLVLHHERVGTERNRHAGHGQKRGDELASHHGVQQLLGNGDARRDGRGEAFAVYLGQEGTIEHQQNDRCNERYKKQPFITKIELDIAPYHRKDLLHASIPPCKRLPVAARKTSSIFPLVIS